MSFHTLSAHILTNVVKIMHNCDYFSIKEFLVDRVMTTVPVHVVDKIERFHKPIINPIRHKLRMPISVSGNSGYRSREWELEHGRKGDSEHTFIGLGAVDYTCEDMDALLHELRLSDYKRVCYYPHKRFIHCDHYGDRYHEFEANEAGVWQYKGERR